MLQPPEHSKSTPSGQNTRRIGKAGYDGPSKMGDNKLVRLLPYVTGLVNQELLLQNEYLAAENRILRTHYRSDCAYQIRNDPRLPRSEKGSGESLDSGPA